MTAENLKLLALISMGGLMRVEDFSSGSKFRLWNLRGMLDRYGEQFRINSRGHDILARHRREDGSYDFADYDDYQSAA